ncbi:heavy-metal-associated domain-containing protein [Persicirhabdus sediminis]|uniref:Cation transporter n=1 Tax=Persicirhabdus sediminis TaxID=454144 RepID=A0A8J7MGD0_9BACT|nr:cation transporter [Persicirhabdus sediminis]MBK1791314.1 cation transporter [Persicirhabdus sediminis]
MQMKISPYFQLAASLFVSVSIAHAAPCPAEGDCEVCKAADESSESCAADCQNELCAAAIKEAKLVKLAYLVDGMKCESCSAVISKSLEKLEGVTIIDLSPYNKLVSVKFDPELSSAEAVAKAIDDAKFDIVGERVTLAVDGMSCGSCEKKISTEIAKSKEMKLISVSADKGLLVVDVRPAELELEEGEEAAEPVVPADMVASAVKLAGFKVVK